METDKEKRIRELEAQLEQLEHKDNSPHEQTRNPELSIKELEKIVKELETDAPETIDSLRNKVEELEKNKNQSNLNDEKQTKPLNLKTETYNKLLALKSGECTTFTKVVEKLIKDNKILENENIELLRFKVSILEKDA